MSKRPVALCTMNLTGVWGAGLREEEEEERGGGVSALCDMCGQSERRMIHFLFLLFAQKLRLFETFQAC